MHSDTPWLDGQLIASHVLGMSRAAMLARLEQPLTDPQKTRLNDLVNDYISGTALPYILGEWDFYGRRFIVTADVLIPRPETELLVEHALGYLDDHPGRCRVGDVGTGSGCIGLTIALERPGIELFGLDISYRALIVARENARRFDLLLRTRLVQSDLLSSVQVQFDLICANLPYIPSERLEQLDVARREPWLALDGGVKGLDIILRLMQQSQRKLKPGGFLLLEIDETQVDAIEQVAENLHYSEIMIFHDLQAKPRLVVLKSGR